MVDGMHAMDGALGLQILGVLFYARNETHALINYLHEAIKKIALKVELDSFFKRIFWNLSLHQGERSLQYVHEGGNPLVFVGDSEVAPWA